jgi:hypothetical protein
MSDKRRTLWPDEGMAADPYRWGMAVVIAVEEFFIDLNAGTTGWVGRTKLRIRQGFPPLGYRPLNDVEIYHLMRDVLRASRGPEWNE